MKCNRCGMELDSGWNYCPTCKSEIVSVNLSSFDGLNIKPIKGFCNKCAFELKDIYQGVFVKDLISRKKQVVPIMTENA